jgi:hypothetical protein
MRLGWCAGMAFESRRLQEKPQVKTTRRRRLVTPAVDAYFIQNRLKLLLISVSVLPPLTFLLAHFSFHFACL